jgi:hypothetical protein
MEFRLETVGTFSAKDATDEDIRRAFGSESARGEFASFGTEIRLSVRFNDTGLNRGNRISGALRKAFNANGR